MELILVSSELVSALEPNATNFTSDDWQPINAMTAEANNITPGL